MTLASGGTGATSPLEEENTSFLLPGRPNAGCGHSQRNAQRVQGPAGEMGATATEGRELPALSSAGSWIHAQTSVVCPGEGFLASNCPAIMGPPSIDNYPAFAKPWPQSAAAIGWKGRMCWSGTKFLASCLS